MISSYGLWLFLWGSLFLLIVVFSCLSEFFLRWENIRNILDQGALLVILSVGMTLVIASGGIDLSVGATAATAGVIAALFMKAGWPAGAAVFAAACSSGLVGFFSGVLISYLRLNPFIVTLGIASISRGLALILTQAMPIYGFPAAFTWLGKGSFLGMPVPVWIAALTALFGFIVLNHTKLGYYALSIGSNEEALSRAGVAVNRYKTALYLLCALTAAVAGIIVAARLNTAEPTAGMLFELEAIAAVVLGGASLKGGRASIPGTVTACLLLATMRNGLTILSVHSYYQQLLTGCIILASVILSELNSRKSIP